MWKNNVKKEKQNNLFIMSRYVNDLCTKKRQNIKFITINMRYL